MSILWVMLPLTLASGGALLALFMWAVRAGQFEGLEDEKYRILFRDPLETQRAVFLPRPFATGAEPIPGSVVQPDVV